MGDMRGFTIPMTIAQITKKQEQILLLIYRFRFLTRIHLQTILHHKDEKRINEWLKDLTQKQYLGRILKKQERISNTPAIYHLGLNGIRFIKTQSVCEPTYTRKLYTESGRSATFISQCLLITDIYISLSTKYEDSPNFAFYTPTDFSREGIIKEISPHFVFRKGEDTSYSVVEIFGDKIPRRALRSRIERYITFFTKGEWIKAESPPNILFICPTVGIELYAIKHVREILTEENISNLRIYSAINDHVKNLGIQAEIWNEVEV